MKEIKSTSFQNLRLRQMPPGSGRRQVAIGYLHPGNYSVLSRAMNRLIANCRGCLVRSTKWLINAVGVLLIRPFLSRKLPVASLRDLPRLRILYVCHAYRGDLILNFPAINALQRCFPGATIDLWATPDSEVLGRMNARVAEVISVENAPRTVRETIRRLLSGDFTRFIAEVRKRDYNVVIDDSATAFSSLVLWKAGIPLRVGATINGFGFLYQRSSKSNFNDNLTDRRRRLVMKAGVDGLFEADFNATHLRPHDKQFRAVASRCEDEALNAGKYFTVQPCAGWKAKEWDAVKLAAVVNAFAQETGLKPLLLGGAGDLPRLATFLREITCPSINLIGKVALDEMLAVMAHSRFHFGVDSVCGHIARLYDIPSVVLFGPTNPQKIARTTERQVAVRAKARCAPNRGQIYCCYQAGRACSNNDSMAGLTVERVLPILLAVWRDQNERELHVLSEAGTRTHSR